MFIQSLLLFLAAMLGGVAVLMMRFSSPAFSLSLNSKSLLFPTAVVVWAWSYGFVEHRQ